MDRCVLVAVCRRWEFVRQIAHNRGASSWPWWETVPLWCGLGASAKTFSLVAKNEGGIVFNSFQSRQVCNVLSASCLPPAIYIINHCATLRFRGRSIWFPSKPNHINGLQAFEKCACETPRSSAHRGREEEPRYLNIVWGIVPQSVL